LTNTLNSMITGKPSILILTLSAVIVLIFQACSEENTSGTSFDSASADSTPVANVAGDSDMTATSVEWKRNVPEGFSLDTINYFDSTKVAEIDILLPVSGIKTLDDRMRREAESRKKEFLKDIVGEGDSGMEFGSGSSFFMEINSIYATDSIISYCFHVSVYSANAAHPFNSYYSYNYNRITGKEITFNDYFDIRSREDTIFLINLLTKIIAIEGVSVDEVKDMDFNLRQDTVSFNFDDYEIASYAIGVIEAPIAKKELTPVIKKEYQ